jgi:superfamily II DNA or RNA helicase
MNIRDKRQEEFADVFLNSPRYGILNLCPRFGKIRTSILILNVLENELQKSPNILIAYPDLKIEQSWKDDFIKFNYNNDNVTFTTHLSLWKYKENVYDVIIVDEIHLLSDAQILVCEEIFSINKTVLGLTGTLAGDTRNNLYQELKIPVIAEYPIEIAVEENVISDFEIEILQVPLDNTKKINYNGKFKTEKQRFDNFSWIIKRMDMEGRDAKFMRLNRMRIIQSSIAKKERTIEILNINKNNRILVFCGLKKIADTLGIPSYHSTTKNRDLLQEFANGEGNQLAVVGIGLTGVTYKPLNRVVISYFSSSSEDLIQKIMRCMSFEYDNPEKKAKITIISSTEATELKWLKKALSKINKDRIVWKQKHQIG